MWKWLTLFQEELHMTTQLVIIWMAYCFHLGEVTVLGRFHWLNYEWQDIGNCQTLYCRTKWASTRKGLISFLACHYYTTVCRVGKNVKVLVTHLSLGYLKYASNFILEMHEHLDYGVQFNLHIECILCILLINKYVY